MYQGKFKDSNTAIVFDRMVYLASNNSFNCKSKLLFKTNSTFFNRFNLTNEELKRVFYDMQKHVKEIKGGYHIFGVSKNSYERIFVIHISALKLKNELNPCLNVMNRLKDWEEIKNAEK